jgi:hypothetical protein
MELLVTSLISFHIFLEYECVKKQFLDFNQMRQSPMVTSIVVYESCLVL